MEGSRLPVTLPVPSTRTPTKGFKSSNEIRTQAGEKTSHEKDEMIDLMMVFPRKANAVGRSIAARYMKDSRLKSYHLMLINAISEQDGASQKDLGDAVPFDKSYISIGVRELIDMGYIVNEGQGKVHSLRLTESGRDVLAMSEMMFDIISQSILGNITKEEKDALVRTLRKMSANMDAVIAQNSERESAPSKRWCEGPGCEYPE